jgi:predicted glycogen debranching enzyme
VTDLEYGTQLCGDLHEASRREWLLTDGVGGYAMGTVAGLPTRRYHGLLVVATRPPIGRQMALAGLDPVLVIGDSRIHLGTWEWSGGSISPAGHARLSSFDLTDGIPSWRWQIGDIVLECSIAMVRGRPAVGVCYRLLAGGPVSLEVGALCTWRDVHGERFAARDPDVQLTSDGFVFEGRYRVAGPDFAPGGDWYRGVWHREEAARGLNPTEDLWFAGRFRASLKVGDRLDVAAWAGSLDDSPGPASEIVADARNRNHNLIAAAADGATRMLTLAADQFVVEAPGAAGPTVVAGYPWFGDWSRDTMTSYEGLFLTTGRFDEGRRLLVAAASSLSEGMLANTADAGGTEYNTVDGTLWFLHAVTRHCVVTDDWDLAADVIDPLLSIVQHHLAGTRFGIGVDPVDGLVRQGAQGWALTWMDARVDGWPVTGRPGKPVEVNALWVNGLAGLGRLLGGLGRDHSDVDKLHTQARAGFLSRFARTDGSGLFDVVDGPDGDDWSVRPNQLLAASLPDGPLARDPEAAGAIRRACAPLLTPLGLRSLSPEDSRYVPAHRGSSAQRDRAYHQGTVWPWLIGPYSDVSELCGRDPSPTLEGLMGHLGDWGLGSISETADADPPHGATGCPFQAWSVAETLRITVRR